MSLRGRLLAASLALVSVGLIVAGLGTFFALRYVLDTNLDSELVKTAQQLERVSTLRARTAFVPGGVWVQVLNPDGSINQTTGLPAGQPAPVLPATLPTPTDVNSAQPFTVPSLQDQPGYRILVAPYGNGTVVVGIWLAEVSSTLAGLIRIELLLGVAVLAATAALGSWLVRIGLRPLEEIEATAATIAAGDLTERVALADDRTEVGRLGKTLNTMLGRIEAAFEERRSSEAALRVSEERLRRFVSDASHELRTPVAAVRAYAELFRRGGDRHPEDLPRMMQRIEAEAARMGVLVEDLLLLTRLDQGRPLEQAPVDLGALAGEAVEAAGTIEPDRPVNLSVEGSVEVLGDRDRLRQVVDNLLTNVRTHTPPGAPATVAVRQVGDRGVIEVADSGPGIDPLDGEHIFERFYRADTSRSRDRGGSGLGLSIVAAIAAAHGGKAAAANRPEGGAVFHIELPILQEAPPAETMATCRPESAPQAWPAPKASGDGNGQADVETTSDRYTALSPTTPQGDAGLPAPPARHLFHHMKTEGPP